MLAGLHAMSENTNTKQPPLMGFWPHEAAIIALLFWTLSTATDQRGTNQPEIYYGITLTAAVGALAWRCREEWRALPGKIFLAALLAAWVALFYFFGNATMGYVASPSLFNWMLDIYTSPFADEQHGLLMPFIVLGLFWWKRKELVAQPAGVWWPALGLVLLGLLLHTVGFVVQQGRLSVLGFFVGLYGLTGLMWGKHWFKASWFPVFLFAFCMPVGELANSLTLPLRLLVAKIVELVGHLGLAPDLIRQGTQLTDAQRTFAYEVAPACSGIRSLVALLAITTIYGFVGFQRRSNRAVMMLAALPLAVLGNVVRLCFTIVVAEVGGQDAGKFVETKFGFITFAVAIGCVYFLTRWLEKFETPAPATTASPHES